MSCQTCTRRADLPADAAAPLFSPARLRQIWRNLRDWAEHARQRRALADLDPRLLRDIGLTAMDARDETDKPVWRR